MEKTNGNLLAVKKTGKESVADAAGWHTPPFHKMVKAFVRISLMTHEKALPF